MKKLALTLSLALVSLSLAAPVLASPGEAKSVSVSTSDLNLASEAGVQALYRRIQGAASEVCKGAEGRSVASQMEHRACLRSAVDGAVVSASNDALTSLHLAKSGRASSTVAAK